MTHSYGFTLHYANACTSLVTWINQNLVNSMETAILQTTRPDPSTAINALCLTQCGFIRKPVSESFWGLYIHVLWLYKWSQKWSQNDLPSATWVLISCYCSVKLITKRAAWQQLDTASLITVTGSQTRPNDTTVRMCLFILSLCTLQPQARGLHV